jgi:hypothetical protein
MSYSARNFQPGSELDRRALVRELIAGYGSGKPCAYCGRTIGPLEIEYEVELSSGRLQFHRACQHLWESEPADAP